MTTPIQGAGYDRNAPAAGGRGAGGRDAGRGVAGDGPAADLAGVLGASFYSVYESELGTWAVSGSSLVGSSSSGSGAAAFSVGDADGRAPIDRSRRTPAAGGRETSTNTAPPDEGERASRAEQASVDAGRGRAFRTPGAHHSGGPPRSAPDTGESVRDPGASPGGSREASATGANTAHAGPAAGLAGGTGPGSLDLPTGGAALRMGAGVTGVQAARGGLPGAPNGGPNGAPSGPAIGSLGARAESARGATLARPIAPPRAQESSSLVAQAVRGLAAALRQRNGSVTMRLSPEALGPLKVTLSVRESRVTAAFRAESAQARDLLTQSMAQLRSAIEARGLVVDRIEVSGPDGDQERSRGDEPAGRFGEQDRRDRSGGDPARDAGASERRGAHARSESGPGDAEAIAGGPIEIESGGRWIALGRLDTLA